MTKYKVRSFIDAVIKMREIATDEQAIEVQNIYPTWKTDCQYKVGDRVLYNEVLYKVLIAHTSQDDWTPDVAVSLFAKVLIVDPSVVSDWVQPDSTNPYMKGDKVSHKGQTWISTVDNNVWEPGVYGWEVVE